MDYRWKHLISKLYRRNREQFLLLNLQNTPILPFRLEKYSGVLFPVRVCMFLKTFISMRIGMQEEWHFPLFFSMNIKKIWIHYLQYKNMRHCTEEIWKYNDSVGTLALHQWYSFLTHVLNFEADCVCLNRYAHFNRGNVYFFNFRLQNRFSLSFFSYFY